MFHFLKKEISKQHISKEAFMYKIIDFSEVLKTSKELNISIGLKIHVGLIAPSVHEL